jgi:hypothetical protein
MTVVGVNYEAEPSYEVADALRAVLIFHSGGDWRKRQAEWLRMTGTREATTRVLCDHVRTILIELEHAHEG